MRRCLLGFNGLIYNPINIIFELTGYFLSGFYSRDQLRGNCIKLKEKKENGAGLTLSSSVSPFNE